MRQIWAGAVIRKFPEGPKHDRRSGIVRPCSTGARRKEVSRVTIDSSEESNYVLHHAHVQLRHAMRISAFPRTTLGPVDCVAPSENQSLGVGFILLNVGKRFWSKLLVSWIILLIFWTNWNLLARSLSFAQNVMNSWVNVLGLLWNASHIHSTPYGVAPHVQCQYRNGKFSQDKGDEWIRRCHESCASGWLSEDTFYFVFSTKELFSTSVCHIFMYLFLYPTKHSYICVWPFIVLSLIGGDIWYSFFFFWVC